MEHRVKKKVSEEAEDQFQRLQDDLVLHILDKVSVVEWLCRCFMVSKRFSSLAPRVQTLSLKSTLWSTLWDSFLKSCPDSNNKIATFLGKYSKLLTKYNLVLQPPPFYRIPSDSFPSSSPNFLHLLFSSKEVRSLNLELFSDFDGHDDSVFKWGAKFTPQLDSVTFLYAKSLSKTVKSEEASENAIAQTELLHLVKLAKRCAKYAISWLANLSRALQNFPILDRVTITDWKNKGVKLCLGGEKLAECRRSMLSPGAPKPWVLVQWYTRVGYVPVLQLPNSGYVMKGVTVVNLRMSVNDYEADTGMVDAMLDAFAEEKGPFMEAMMQILEKHKDSIEVQR